MNARTLPSDLPLTELRIKLTSPYSKSIVVSPYGFAMECEYDFQAGEPARVSGGPENWHPGTPPNVALMSCRIGGVEVMDLLTNGQSERIEEAILEALEG